MARVTNASNRKQVQRANWREKAALDSQQNDFRLVLATPPGRRLLWSLLDRCLVFKPLGHDALLIHSNEGRRLVGLELMADLTASDPQAYLLLLQEALKAQTLEQNEDNALGNDDDD